MRRTVFCAIALMFLGGSLSAQQARSSIRPEFRPFAGVLIPTGNLRDDFKSAETAGAQLAVEVTPLFHLVGSVGWTHGHHKFTQVSNDRTDVWQYDVGIEANPLGRFGTDWELRPFVGIGGGGRTNDYISSTFGTTTAIAGYGALGTELQRGILAFRVEGRDYLAHQESPVTGVKKTRNDIRLSFGLALHLH